MFKTAMFYIAFFLGLFWFSIGCADPFHTLEAHYHAGQYPEALISARKGLEKNPNDARILEFLTAHHTSLFDRANRQVDRLAQHLPNKSVLSYLDRLIVEADAFVVVYPAAAPATEQFKTRRSDLVEHYLSLHKQAADRALVNHDPKTAISHFEAMLDYAEDAAPILAQLQPLYAAVRRHVMVYPILTQPFSQQAILSGSYKTRNSPVILQGENITAFLDEGVTKAMHKRQSDTLMVYFPPSTPNQAVESLVLFLTIEEDDRSTQPVLGFHDDTLRYSQEIGGVLGWYTAPFRYETNAYYYAVTVTLKGVLYPPRPAPPRHLFTLTKTGEDRHVVQGQAFDLPHDYVEIDFPLAYDKLSLVQGSINKNFVVREVLTSILDAFLYETQQIF